MAKDVIMQPVTAQQILKIVVIPNGDGTWTATAFYQIVDNIGTIWKQNQFTAIIANGNATLSQVLNSGLNSINLAEGL